MKRVLTVSYYAPPTQNAESILVWKTLRSLSKSHEVSLLTVMSHGVESPDLELPSEINVIRLWDAKPVNRTLRRFMERAIGMALDENILWSRSAKRKAVWSVRDFDVIYSRSQPGASHVVAWRLKQQSEKPWIAQFSDPWANNPYHTTRTGIRQNSDRRWEARVVHDADLLIFPTKEIQGLYHSTYPQQNVLSKSVVLPHHYTPELYGDDERVPNEEHIGTTTIRYFGDFYGIRSPEPFVEALRVFAEKNPEFASNVTVEFVGNIESKFQSLINGSPIPIQRTRMSYVESLREMKKTDILLLVDAPSTNGINIFMPSKLMDYLGAGRPILAITAACGTTSDILRASGHYVEAHENIEGIARGLKTLTQEPQVRPIPLEFATDRVVDQLAELIERFA